MTPQHDNKLQITGRITIRLEDFENEDAARAYLRTILKPELAELYAASRAIFDGGVLEAKKVRCNWVDSSGKAHSGICEADDPAPIGCDQNQ